MQTLQVFLVATLLTLHLGHSFSILSRIHGISPSGIFIRITKTRKAKINSRISGKTRRNSAKGNKYKYTCYRPVNRDYSADNGPDDHLERHGNFQR